MNKQAKADRGAKRRSMALPRCLSIPPGALFKPDVVLSDDVGPFGHLGADVVAELPRAERRHDRSHLRHALAQVGHREHLGECGFQFRKEGGVPAGAARPNQ